MTEGASCPHELLETWFVHEIGDDFLFKKHHEGIHAGDILALLLGLLSEECDFKVHLTLSETCFDRMERLLESRISRLGNHAPWSILLDYAVERPHPGWRNHILLCPYCMDEIVALRKNIPSVDMFSKLVLSRT